MVGRSIGRAVAVVGRVLGYSVLGAVCGVLLGFTIGVIHAPPTVPGDSLANEWYTPFVLLIMFVECIAGFLMGLGIAIGFGIPSDRRKAFTFALGGAVLGIGLAWILAWIFYAFLGDRQGRAGSELMSSLVLQAAGAVGGMMLAASLQQTTGIKPPLSKS